jgi:hypothetical protein
MAAGSAPPYRPPSPLVSAHHAITTDTYDYATGMGGHRDAVLRHSASLRRNYGNIARISHTLTGVFLQDFGSNPGAIKGRTV